MAFGQVIEMALCAVQEAFAENTARSDGDLRLADMITRAQRIALGVHEDKDALLLIFVQKAERDWNDRGARDARSNE